MTVSTTGNANKLNALKSTLTVLALSVVATASYGQTELNDTSGKPELKIIEEILVTASKRGSISAQDLASPITAFNADKLEQLNALDFEDFIVQVPGTNFIDNGGPGRGQEVSSIRGLSPVADNTDPVVAVYLDGAPRSGKNYRLFDISEVSILRGPQGTLWGSQAIGGLISYKSQRPDTELFDAHIGTDIYSTTGAGDTSYRVDGHVNIPIIQNKFAVRIAGHNIDESGYVDNVFTGDNNINNVEESAWRISALYTPTKNLDLTAIYHRGDLTADAPTYFSLDFKGRETDDLKSNLPTEQVYDLFNFIVDWDLDWANLNYTGSYFELGNSFYGIDDAVFGVPGWFADEINITEEESRTHEIRLSSNGGGPLNWIAGIYYDELEGNYEQKTLNTTDPSNPEVGPAFGEGFEFIITGGPEDRTETAVFGEVIYDFNDQWQVLVGARWFDWEIDNNQQFTFFGYNYQQITGKVGDDDLFYKLQLTYAPTEDLLFYGLRSEGFRFGGFNPFAGPALGIPQKFGQYDPDTLINYEAGAKMTFLDGRMQLNSALYFMEWKSIQAVVWNEAGNFAFTSNGPDLDANGFELELVTQDLLFPGFYGAATYTYSTNEFQNDAVIFPENGRDPLISKGDELRRTPKNSWSFDLGYDFTVIDGLDGYVRANYWHKDKTSTESFNSNDGIIDIPAHDVVNVSAGVTSTLWTVKLYVDNIGDKRPLLNVTPDAIDLTRAGIASSIRPRTVGFQVAYRFGKI